MACRDVWNTWPLGLQSPQNPPASPSGFVVPGVPRAMYFTHHGKPWLKPTTRHFWLCRSQLKLAKGVLTYLWEVVEGQTPLLLVPRKMQKSILELFHDAPTGGHLGRDNTIAKIRQRYLWYGLSTDVRLHVAACPRCGRGKHKRNTPRAPLTNYQGGFPGDRVHLDILGPFCESTKGNRYVLMIIDQFSRWLGGRPAEGYGCWGCGTGIFLKLCGALWCAVCDPHRPGAEFWQCTFQVLLRDAAEYQNSDNTIPPLLKWTSRALQHTGAEFPLLLPRQKTTRMGCLPPCLRDVR